jgi:hypothetical protein
VRIVFVTQAADAAHPVLGATLPKIRALAERCDEVVVLADRVDASALPAGVRARSFAAPSQAARGARYLAALAPELVDRPIAVVAHMAPVFALLAAPLTKPLRVPLLLWFTQQAAGTILRVAERVTFGGDVAYAQVPHLLGLADAVVNATRGNAADKVVYEAAAACLPVFAASPVFDTLLPQELRFHADDPSSLAERIRDYGGGAGRELRGRVEAGHSVGHWADRVLEVAGG